MADDHGDVLLVENERMVGSILGRYLEQAGYRVHQTQSGLEALDAMKNNAQGVRTIVTDLRLNGMTGLELARELFRRYPGARVLFVAGQPWDGEPLPGPLLLKPFTADELVNAVRRLISEERPPSADESPRSRKL